MKIYRQKIQKTHCIFILLVLMFLSAHSAPVMAWERAYENETCRKVIKKFKINRTTTFTEKGTACLSDFGDWEMVTDSQFSDFLGAVYFKRNGRLVYMGNLYPQDSWITDHRIAATRLEPEEPRRHCPKRRGYKDSEKVDFGWGDTKSYKKHSNHHFFD